jgi:hypothetical protein
MGTAYKGSVYKFKQMEMAYDSLQNAGLYDLADSVAEVMAREGYYPKLVGNKWKFKYGE